MTQDEYNTQAPYEGMSPGRYIATRFSSLKPPMHNVPNPIKLLRMLNSQQWAFFFVAFVAWVRLHLSFNLVFAGHWLIN